MEALFFKDWNSILRIVIATVVSYSALLLLIRLVGKRSLSKMNAFDFVVTVTMGSTLSSLLLNKVPVVDGVVSLILILGLQYVLAFIVQRSKKIEKAVNSVPAILFYNGEFITSAMERERITKDEVLAEIRSYRIEQLSEVRAVIMEINGTFSVLKKSELSGASSLSELEEQQASEIRRSTTVKN